MTYMVFTVAAMGAIVALVLAFYKPLFRYVILTIASIAILFGLMMAYGLPARYQEPVALHSGTIPWAVTVNGNLEMWGLDVNAQTFPIGSDLMFKPRIKYGNVVYIIIDGPISNNTLRVARFIDYSQKK